MAQYWHFVGFDEVVILSNKLVLTIKKHALQQIHFSAFFFEIFAFYVVEQVVKANFMFFSYFFVGVFGVFDLLFKF